MCGARYIPLQEKTGSTTCWPEVVRLTHLGTVNQQVSFCSFFSGSTMTTKVTRSKRADGTTEDQESDRNEASAGMIGPNVVASESTDPDVQVRMKELEMEGLKLQIELQKLEASVSGEN
ncbi:hypothetical protein MRX96_045016 [Rhipicephalus microplus]